MKSVLTAFISLLSLLLLPVAGVAAAFPNKPVKLIVPFTPGAPEAVVRQAAERLAKKWGQPVVVENRPGAGGNIAAMAGARAEPDGYTLLLVTDVLMTVNPLMYKELGFDPIKDFVPVSTLLEFPSAMFVSRSSGITSVADLVAQAKADPGKLTYGSWGVGSASHLGVEQFKALSGIDLLHIPYKGLSAIEVAMKAGELDVGFAGVGSSIRGRRNQMLEPIAVAGNERHPGLPDVQTFAEAGYPKMRGPNWWGFVLPAATPRNLVEQISADIQDIASDPAFKAELLEKHNYSLVGDTPEQFATRIRVTAELWTPVVESLKLEKQ